MRFQVYDRAAFPARATFPRETAVACRWLARALNAAAGTSIGSRWAYRIVTAGVECPAHPWTNARRTPPARSDVTNRCRNAWSRARPGPITALHAGVASVPTDHADFGQRFQSIRWSDFLSRPVRIGTSRPLPGFVRQPPRLPFEPRLEARGDSHGKGDLFLSHAKHYPAAI